jgi:virulence factor Mce-like protein
MRRLLLTLLLVAAGAALTGFAGCNSGADRPRFSLELDNAFGVVEGGDVKVAGARAGKVTSVDLDKRAMRARIGFELDRDGFRDLRTDTFCEVRPQSLVGEYFIDCRPGTASQRLKPGDTIPASRTAATVPADLVADIMRRPYRERFSLILAELGTAVAARGADLNATIRRASPALRATQQTLAAIAADRHTLRDLIANARTVIEALSDRRRDVSRFIVEARDTARVSGRRSDDIAAQWRALPGFLRELRPAMARLGETADHSTPALRRLRGQASALTTLLDRSVPFLDRSRPFTRTLARVSAEGSRGVGAATARVKQLQRFAKPLPEVAGNLQVILEHLADRGHAVERDARSPGGKGFTGLEALMRYVYVFQQASNVYDGNSYMVKTGSFVDPACSPWAGVAEARDASRKRCRAQLGPSRPGIDTPDPTLPPARTRGDGRRGPDRPTAPAVVPKATARLPDVPAPTTGVPGPVGQLLDGIVGALPQVPKIDVPAIGPLLDYLLGA